MNDFGFQFSLFIKSIYWSNERRQIEVNEKSDWNEIKYINVCYGHMHGIWRILYFSAMIDLMTNQHNRTWTNVNSIKEWRPGDRQKENERAREEDEISILITEDIFNFIKICACAIVSLSLTLCVWPQRRVVWHEKYSCFAYQIQSRSKWAMCVHKYWICIYYYFSMRKRKEFRIYNGRGATDLILSTLLMMVHLTLKLKYEVWSMNTVTITSECRRHQTIGDMLQTHQPIKNHSKWTAARCTRSNTKRANGHKICSNHSHSGTRTHTEWASEWQRDRERERAKHHCA